MKSRNNPGRKTWFEARKGLECECRGCGEWTLGRFDGKAICKKCHEGALMRPTNETPAEPLSGEIPRQGSATLIDPRRTYAHPAALHGRCGN